MAWNEMNERRMKELELISSSLGLTAPQVEEIEELIDLKEQSDAKPEYRKPTKWDVNRKCEVFSERYGSGSWIEATILYGLVSGGGAYVRLKINAKLELYAADDIRILVDEDDIEWQFKCKMLDIIAGHAGDLNSRCFQAPFEDEKTGRIYSLKLEWLNRERFCEPVPDQDEPSTCKDSKPVMITLPPGKTVQETIDEMLNYEHPPVVQHPIKRPFRWCKAKYKYPCETFQTCASEYDFVCILHDDKRLFHRMSYSAYPAFLEEDKLTDICFIDGETL